MRGDGEKEVDVGRGHIATHGWEPDIRDGLEGACRGDWGQGIWAPRWTGVGILHRPGLGARHGHTHLRLSLPAPGWQPRRRAAAHGGWRAGQGLWTRPHARQVVRGGAGSEGRGREKKLSPSLTSCPTLASC